MKTKVWKMLTVMLVLACAVFVVETYGEDLLKQVVYYHYAQEFQNPGIYVIATETNPLEMSPLDLIGHVTTVASSEDFISIFISRGCCPSSGYCIGIESVERNGYTFILDAIFTDPGRSIVVATVITNPGALIPIGKLPVGEYSIILNIARFLYEYMGGDRGGEFKYFLKRREVWASTFRILDGPGVLNVATPKTVIGQGFNLNISLAVGNYAVETETFNVTVYANATAIATFENITLPSRNSTTLTFTWNTAGFAKGNYTINVMLNPEDNTPLNCWVCIVTHGDVNADGIVNIMDVYTIAKAFGSYAGHSRYDPNADINSDGKINIEDIFIISKTFGK